MNKKRIKYEIGLSNRNGYCIEYNILSKDCNESSELIKAWILHFYKIIYNYGNRTDENVVALFDFLLHIKSLDYNESLSTMIDNKYGKFSVVNMKDCGTKIKGETFDIINSGVGINISFPLSVNQSNVNASILALSIFIWEQLNSQEAKELFLDIVSDIYETREDTLIYTLQGNVILPNRLIEKYSDRIEDIGINDLIIVEELVQRPADEISQMRWKVDDDYTSKKVDKRNGCRTLLVGSFYGFILGVIVTLIITSTYYKLEAFMVDEENVETSKKDSETYLIEGKRHLNEVMFSEVKTEDHILDWGYAVFDIYNGTEYTIKAVVIEISIFNEKGEVVDVRKYKEEFLVGIDSYSTVSIEFDTGITGIGQVAVDDTRIPDHLVSWRFVEIIVGDY